MARKRPRSRDLNIARDNQFPAFPDKKYYRDFHYIRSRFTRIYHKKIEAALFLRIT